MAESAKIRKHVSISTAGLGITVGSLGTVVPFPTLVIFSIGIGIMLAGIFKSIYTVAEKAEQSGAT